MDAGWPQGADRGRRPPPAQVGNLEAVHHHLYPEFRKRAEQQLREIGSRAGTASSPLPRELMHLSKTGWRGQFMPRASQFSAGPDNSGRAAGAPARGPGDSAQYAGLLARLQAPDGTGGADPGDQAEISQGRRSGRRHAQAEPEWRRVALPEAEDDSGLWGLGGPWLPRLCRLGEFSSVACAGKEGLVYAIFAAARDGRATAPEERLRLAGRFVQRMYVKRYGGSHDGGGVAAESGHSAIAQFLTCGRCQPGIWHVIVVTCSDT